MASAPTSGGDEHERGADLGRVVPALHGLDDHPDGERAEQQGVGQGREDLGALEAEGRRLVRRPGRQPGRDEGDRDAGGVGEHVPGVGEERERPGDEAADDLDADDARA